MYSAQGQTKVRLKQPRLFMGDQWVDTTWDEAMQIYPGLTQKILDQDGPSGLVFNCFDHGGAGGGFENTGGSGKLMSTALQTPMVDFTRKSGHQHLRFFRSRMEVSDAEDSEAAVHG